MGDFEKILQTTGEVGYVERIVHPVVHANGLPMAKTGEVVQFEGGSQGSVTALSDDTVQILTFSAHPVAVGERIARTGKQFEIPVGPQLLGKIIDPQGMLIGQEEEAKFETTVPIQVEPPGIDKRKKIGKPLKTGVAMADIMVPIGRGQRELLMGGGNTGKSSFAYQAIVTQARQGVVCIYAAIGKKMTTIKRTEKYFEEQGVRDQIIIIASASEDSPTLVYLCPYTAMSIAEYFRDRGQDVLLVLDDLSTHAKFYREISLLGGSFPGRESYPGDIFHIHATLLERAGNFKRDDKDGEVSITCLPVVAMPSSKFGYIQTNLISITDGHIYFDTDLFTQGRRPAINPYLSVTRVGHQSQTIIEQQISRETLTFLGRYDKMQSFVRFGAELTDDIKQVLDKGNKIIAFFNQPLHILMPAPLQVFLFTMVWADLWRSQTVEEMEQEIEKIVKNFSEDKESKDLVEKTVGAAKDWTTFLESVKSASNPILAKIRKNAQPASAESSGEAKEENATS